MLDATDLLAPPPARPDPHWGMPAVLWGAWTARAPRSEQPPFDWPAAHTDLYRHFLLPGITRATGHHVDVAPLGTRVLATHLDGEPLRHGEPTSLLPAHHVLAGHRCTLDPAQVLAYALLRDDLAALLGPALAAPTAATPDLALVLAAAEAGLSAAEIVRAHRDGTLTPDRIALLTALLGTF
ncbi:hypothetical protein [Kineococcus sp. SYSU DK003]|uniref:hypothetical protein n=1 Tax=Kineococcus sp. SYSU DK003 TaxID=3383124 RepID=UPI003D7C57C4